MNRRTFFKCLPFVTAAPECLAKVKLEERMASSDHWLYSQIWMEHSTATRCYTDAYVEAFNELLKHPRKIPEKPNDHEVIAAERMIPYI